MKISCGFLGVWAFGLFLVAIPMAAVAAGKSLGYLQATHLSDDQKRTVAAKIVDGKSVQQYIRQQLGVNDQQLVDKMELIRGAIQKGEFPISSKTPASSFVIEHKSDDEKVRVEISLKGLGHFTTNDKEDGEIDLQPILDAIETRGKGSVYFIKITNLPMLHVDNLEKDDAQKIARAILKRSNSLEAFAHGIEGHFYDKNPDKSGFNIQETDKGLQDLKTILENAVENGDYTKTLIVGKNQVSNNRFKIWATMDSTDAKELVGQPYIGRWVSSDREIAKTNRYYVIFELSNLRFYPSLEEKGRVDAAKTVELIAKDPTRGKVVTFVTIHPNSNPKGEEKPL